MSKKDEKLEGVSNESHTVLGTGFEVILPLKMEWQPKCDITTYELAMCLPYFFRAHGIMPYEVDTALPHFRHFKITGHGK